MKAYDLVIYTSDDRRLAGRVQAVTDGAVAIHGESQAIPADQVWPASQWVAAAWQFGGGVVANGGRRTAPNAEEREDIAAYHESGAWAAMSQADQCLARAAFAAGAAHEQRGVGS